ncbi:MAG: SurA N-terminal domain-containing protein [Nitrospiria bacterium]
MSRWILKKGALKCGTCLLLLGLLFGGQAIESAPLAEVNQATITEAAVDEAVQTYLRQIGHRKLSLSRMTTLKKEALTRLIEEELLYQEGLKEAMVVTEDEVEEEVMEIRQRFPSSEAFEAALKKKELTLEEIKKGVRRFVLIRKTRDSISQLTETDRRNRLKEITENAVIKIHEDLLVR